MMPRLALRPTAIAPAPWQGRDIPCRGTQRPEICAIIRSYYKKAGWSWAPTHPPECVELSEISKRQKLAQLGCNTSRRMTLPFCHKPISNSSYRFRAGHCVDRCHSMRPAICRRYACWRNVINSVVSFRSLGTNLRSPPEVSHEQPTHDLGDGGQRFSWWSFGRTVVG